ncbi:MAG: hypothetical protein HN348_25170 [Proteobacteria bacterium]|nr:hypothetical protein [Pseudomonadota bacterium]
MSWRFPKQRLWVQWLAIAFLVVSLSTEVFAQSPPPPDPSHPSAQAPRRPAAGKVGVELMVVHAHNDNNRVDPQLNSIMQNLRFIKYQGFSLLDRFPSQLGIQQEAAFSVAGGRKLKVQLLERDDRQAKVRVRMFSGDDKILDTTVSIHRNRSFMLAGPKYENGVLILSVNVEY